MTNGAQAQRSDAELGKDSVLGWKYIINPPKQQAYKPIKDNVVPGATYTAWQQGTADLLYKWVQQSCLPKGLVLRNVLKENQQWWLSGAPALHSYGIQLIGFEAHFLKGKINLQCCEKGQFLSLGFNSFPGDYITGGFNPNGLYLFAEIAQFSTGDDEKKLTTEGIDKQILPQLHSYRTYLDHYHDNGKAWNRIGVAVIKNGEWPFKPVLVKEIIDYINRQLAAYPGIAQKNPYAMESIKKALDRLQPYANEVAKLRETNYYNAMYKDDNGHAILDPNIIFNDLPASKAFPEYRILVSATQQVIDQSKTDKPMWLYMNFAGNGTAIPNTAQFDPKLSTERDHFANTLLRNFNFEYVSNWLSQPEKMKNVPYTPLK